MGELLDFLSGEVNFRTVWVIAAALLLVAAGLRSAWPAFAAAILILLYYFLIEFQTW